MTGTTQPTSPGPVKVQLTARTTMALDRAAAATGDSRTDTINRAVQLYDQLVAAVEAGGRVLIAGPDGEERVDVPPADKMTIRQCSCDCPECHNGCCGGE